MNETRMRQEIDKLQKEKELRELQNEYMQLKLNKILNECIIEVESDTTKIPHYPILRHIATMDNELYWFTNIISNGIILRIDGIDNIAFENFSERRKLSKITVINITHDLNIYTLQRLYTKGSIFGELFN